MATRNYKDIYTLEVNLPEQQLQQFGNSLKELRDAFAAVKSAVSGGALASVTRAFGARSVENVAKYADALLRVAGSVRGIGASVINVLPVLRTFETELAKLSSVKVTPTVELKGVSGGEDFGKVAEQQAKIIQTAYQRMSARVVRAFADLIREGNVFTSGQSAGIEGLNRALGILVTNLGEATRAENAVAEATNRAGQALANNTALSDRQKAVVAQIVQQAEVRERARVQAEAEIAVYEREVGILPRVADARAELIKLLVQEGVTGANANDIIRERLNKIGELQRAEQRAAAERRVQTAELQAQTAAIASNTVQKSLDRQSISATKAGAAYQAILTGLKGFRGTAPEAIALAERLAGAFERQTAAANKVGAASYLGRLGSEKQLTAELIKQLQLQGNIDLTTARLPSIIQQVVAQQQKFGFATKEAALAVETILARERELAQVGRGPGNRELSTFAQLGVLSIAASKIEQGLRTVTDAFGQFESALVEIRKTAGATQEQMDALGISLLNISQNIPITATEFAKIVGVLGQVGALEASGKSVEGFAESAKRAAELVAQVAIATDLSAEEAAKSYGQFRAIFSRDIESLKAQITALTGVTADNTDALRAMFGAMNEVQNQTVATVGDLNQFIQAFGGVATSAGVAFERIAALGGAVRDLGVSPQVAGTALSRLFQDAIRRADVFAKVVGTSTREWINLFEVDAEEALLQFLEGLGKLSAAERTRVLSQIAARQRLQQVVVKLADATVKESDSQKTLRQQLDRTNDVLNNYQSVQNEAEKFSATWVATLNRLSNSVTAVGNAMRPVLKVLSVFLDALAGIVTAVANAPFVGPFLVGIVSVGAAILAVRLKFKLLQITLELALGKAATFGGILRALVGTTEQVAVATGTATAAVNSNTVAQVENAAAIGTARAATVGDTVATELNTAATLENAGAQSAQSAAIAGTVGRTVTATGGMRNFGAAITETSVKATILGGTLLNTTKSLFRFGSVANLALTGVAIAASVAGDAIGKMIGGKVGEDVGNFITSLGNITFALSAILPLIARIGVAFSTWLAGGTAGAVALSGALATVKTVAIAAGSLIAGAFSVVPLLITAAIAAITLLIVKLSPVGDAYREAFAGWVDEVESGQAGFFKRTLVGFASLIDTIALGSLSINEYRGQIRGLYKDLDQLNKIALGGLPAYLTALGFSLDQIRLISTGIGTGIIKLGDVLGKPAEDIQKLIQEQGSLLRDTVAVQQALKDQGKTAEKIKEAFEDFDGTSESLRDLAEDLDLSEVLEDIPPGGAVPWNVSSMLEANELIGRAGKGLESSGVAIDGMNEALKKFKDTEEDTIPFTEVLKATETVQDVKTLEEGYRRLAQVQKSGAEELLAITARRAEVEKSIASAQQTAERARFEAQTQRALFPNSDDPAVTLRIEASERVIEQAEAAITTLRNQLASLDQEISLAEKVVEAASGNVDAGILLQRAEIAKKELDRRRKQAQAEKDFITKARDDLATEQIKTQDETVRKLLDIARDYQNDVRKLEEAGFEDYARIEEARVILQQKRFARVTQFLREYADERKKIEEKGLDDSQKALKKQQEALVKNLGEITKKYKDELTAAQKALATATKNAEAFTSVVDTLLGKLDDPFTKITRSIKEVGAEIQSLITKAVDTGDASAIVRAFQLGAEAIKQQAYEAGKALGDLEVKRNKLQKRADSLSAREQASLAEFRDAFIRNLQDADITEVERGRRAQLLRERAEVVFGDGEAGQIAQELSSILENKRLLEANLKQADLQTSIEAEARKQTALLEQLAVASGINVQRLQDGELRQTDRDVTSEELTALRDALAKIPTAGVPKEQRDALEEELRKAEFRVRVAEEKAVEAAKITGEEGTTPPSTATNTLEELRKNEEQLRLLTARQKELEESSKQLNDQLKNMPSDVGKFREAILSATTLINTKLGGTLSAEDVTRGALSRLASDEALRNAVQNNQDSRAMDSLEALGIKTGEASDSALNLLSANNAFLQKTIDTLDALTIRMQQGFASVEEAKRDLDRAKAAAAGGQTR